MQDNLEQKNVNFPEDPEYSFRVLLTKWGHSILYLVSFWKLILVTGFFGLIAGLITSWLTPTTYTARLSFVVEESKQGGGSLVSALAGQIGMDLGGISPSGGMLSGDNVLELLKSRSLIKKTLLTSAKDSSMFSLADEYADAYEWKEKWRSNSKVGKMVYFPTNKINFTRQEDSLLQVIIKKIAEDQLSITKPDKKLNFFEISFINRDEKLSQLFAERLLKITTDFYIETKTRRLRGNIDRLQKRSDSIGALLDRKTYSAAQASEGLIDINPAYSTQTVSAEISSRNKFIQSTIYGELVKNLEVSKTSLIQETPTFQIVDSPELPLKRNRISALFGSVVGTFLGMLAIVVYLLIKKETKEP
jgi:hypothetical protein